MALAYKGPVEAVLSTDLRGEPYHFMLWDLHTGTQLVVFKGSKGNIQPKCLSLIDNNYFLTNHGRAIHIWSIHNKKCQDQKPLLPEKDRPSVLCTSPCGQYLIAAMSDMINVWQLHSGLMLAAPRRHYQTISVLKMNRIGSLLFSGGEDGIVHVWRFGEMISATVGRSGKTDAEPIHTWQHHSAQVTDLHPTKGNLCFTSSADSTINIYSYTSGNRVHCVLLPTPIWSLAMNKNETILFAGGQDGNIHEVLLSSLSLALFNEQAKSSEPGSVKPIFSGHKGKVNGLLVSLDGTRLVSASVDTTCKIWDIHTRNVIHEIKHQAPLANIVSVLVPDSFALSTLTQSHTKPPLHFVPLSSRLFKISTARSLPTDGIFSESVVVHCPGRAGASSSTNKFGPMVHRECNGWTPNSDEHQSATKQSSSEDTSSEQLRKRLRELYQLSVDRVFNDAASACLERFKDVAEEVESPSCEKPQDRARKARKRRWVKFATKEE